MARDNQPTLLSHLADAYKYFYPEESSSFIPEVVDFFSVLRAYEDIGKGFTGAFKHPGLLNELRLAIVRILCDGLRQLTIPSQADPGWAGVETILSPGNIVITSNWDLFPELYARTRGIPLRLGGEPADSHVTVVKLHGSIDWTEQAYRRAGYPDDDFTVLRELQNARKYSPAIEPDDVLRIRATEHMNRSWQFIKARTSQPLMVMMSQGKTVDVEPIKDMWDSAYRGLSVTRHLRIIGYSLPSEDIEIRALLRSGVSRGAAAANTTKATVTVVNPEPSVHTRVREYVSRTIRSDYRAYDIR